MARFEVGDTVRVLVSWSAISDQIGTVLDVVNRSNVSGDPLYLVKFPDRFMRYYTELELGPASSRRSSEDF